jgi:hypothetical protein
MSDVPHIEVTIAAPADEVWRALRDPELIRRWHGWHFDGLDEEIRLIYVDHVAEEDPGNHVLVLQDSDRFTLHPAPGGGTVVRVTRAPRGSNPEWDAYYDDITEGWITFLEQLRFGLERHGLAERRTLFLAGQLRDAGQPMAAALGLAEAAELPVGAAYRATAPTGDELAGEVFARSAHQLAVTVAGLGDGLIVVGQQVPGPSRPTGGVMLVLTAYGTTEADFAALERRWTGWWDTVRAETPAAPVP